ncbi:DUF6790 family protein [Streptomyces vinaceus]|uniref:DUF6790 family protein n=1 Tax=Streptomyces vinaceus TaxID=1960 RepID=UPI0037F3FCED
MGRDSEQRGQELRPGAARALSCVHLVGLAWFIGAEAIQLAGEGYTQRSLLLNFITYLIGVNGITIGAGHILLGVPVARSIGWSTRTPWQWEVGCANFSYGIPGVMVSGQDEGFWLAVVVVAAVFLLGAAIGHVREYLTLRNASLGNIGFVLYSDVIIPLVAIGLYLWYTN